MESHTTLLDVPTPDAHVAHVGRPRSASADEAIISATASLLVEVGYRALCMEAIAARAGVSKATLYRRHKDKQALVTAMIIATVGTPPQEHGLPPGTTRQGLGFMLSVAAKAMSQPSWMPILGAMLSEGPREGGLSSVLRSHIFEPSAEIVAQLVEAGVARGELLPGTSAEVVNDVLFGALLVRSLLGKEIDDDWVERVLSGVLAGFGARSAAAAQTAADAETGERTPARVYSWD